jgi:hypothetical protein
MVLAAFGVAVLAFGIERAGLAKVPDGIMGIAWLALGLAWILFARFSHRFVIHPVEITDRSITLAGVSEEYAEAVRSARRNYRPARRIARASRRRAD